MTEKEATEVVLNSAPLMAEIDAAIATHLAELLMKSTRGQLSPDEASTYRAPALRASGVVTQMRIALISIFAKGIRANSDGADKTQSAVENFLDNWKPEGGTS